jgi:hypothetical protein
MVCVNVWRRFTDLELPRALYIRRLTLLGVAADLVTSVTTLMLPYVVSRLPIHLTNTRAGLPFSRI